MVKPVMNEALSQIKYSIAADVSATSPTLSETGKNKIELEISHDEWACT